MKTLEILDKYRKILAPIISCKHEDIKFYTNKSDKEIGSVCYEKEEVEKHWNLGTYKVIQQIGETQKIISTFKLYQLQHCCAFMVSCNAFVTEDYRNKRIGTIMNNLRQDIGRLLGYTAILCTDIEKNVYQRKLLATNGWKDLYDVINKRTKNRVFISVINI